jgi:ferrous iron transport protein B
MLGVVVIPTVATKKTGVAELLKAVTDVSENKASHEPRLLRYDEDIEAAADVLIKKLRQTHPLFVHMYPNRWLALKLMEEDSHVVEELKIDIDKYIDEDAVHHLRDSHGDDIESFLADERYAQAAGLTREVLDKPEIQKIELTERIDRIVLNRYAGIPIFLLSMWLVFKLTFDISTPFIDWIDAITAGPLSRWTDTALFYLKFPDWTVSLVTDGIIGGVGFVIVFVPVIFTMMFFITFLEGSGYMARAAFVMDRAMHSMGLHGKSFIPMLLGFGCNVPAVYATRTLENSRDKALTALLIPLMSCGARLPVYVLFTSVFFAAHSGTVLWSLYLLGIVLAVIMGIIFKRTLFKGESPMFIMELPPYRMPTLKSLLIHTWEKGKHFLIKAGTYILAMSIIVWFFLNLPWGGENKKDSYLGRAGVLIAPLFEPLGFGSWEAASSLLTGIIAKEIVVGTMGEIYITDIDTEGGAEGTPSFQEDISTIVVSFAGAVRTSLANIFSTFGIASLSTEQEDDQASLRSMIRKTFTPLSAYAFMAFVLLYMPCMVVAIAMKHEFGTWKWFIIAVVYQTALAWTVAFIIYQGGSLLGLGA